MANQVDLATIYEMARNSYDALWDAARSYGRDVKLYLHWSAGHYDNIFDDYHINIGRDGELYVTGDFDEVKDHTWHRNSGSIGISLCCCAYATSRDLGPEAPTEAQIEAMSQVITVLSNALDLTINIERVLTHGEAADNADGYEGAYGEEDCYGPQHDCERWDLQFLGTEESPAFVEDYDDPSTGGNILRGKANWYRTHWEEVPADRPY